MVLKIVISSVKTDNSGDSTAISPLRFNIITYPFLQKGGTWQACKGCLGHFHIIRRAMKMNPFMTRLHSLDIKC